MSSGVQTRAALHYNTSVTEFLIVLTTQTRKTVKDMMIIMVYISTFQMIYFYINFCPVPSTLSVCLSAEYV